MPELCLNLEKSLKFVLRCVHSKTLYHKGFYYFNVKILKSASELGLSGLCS